MCSSDLIQSNGGDRGADAEAVRTVARSWASRVGVGGHSSLPKRLRGSQGPDNAGCTTAKSPESCIVHAPFSWIEAYLSRFQHSESR